ncbi:prephenate dehydratase [Brevibacillus laterosporus]|uniref:Prephenate dehydratase n=1 Tax=Brevibacillus laterosporus TaxID=1465 RepID=A0AAP3DCP2_BRELA|nr:prephenate dehydratase [Brevibacillus laterosporus]MCR8978803.1 prephenate dehydratase [Brevibacillus laterosporus]MCZ0805959.1 prephenate dehydratase [Brevibacillus laterosporus]MCZ0824294.1 prephenate dehydratase [Brevibacillus laterosporus]MCZ0848201.1 prephenate dehydratase [Brevibacillus laterosporus]MED1664427.1 prephenate dehydratase [Brevibacillus laterosporus]
MGRTLAFLGPSGTFTEEAVRHLPIQEELSTQPYVSILDVLEAVYTNQTDFGVVPIENSIEGTVNLTMDGLIHGEKLPILAELAMPITQHLLMATRPEPLSLQQITKVLSHSHAIAQCHLFLQKYLPHVEIEYTNSTALAAKLVSEQPDQPWAAIGTRLNTEIYPLTFAQESIQDYANNFTRFVLLGKSQLDLPVSDKYKTTILVTLPEDYSGALYQVLAAFAWRKLNLSRIESRPTKKGLGSYHFVLDIVQSMDAVLMPGAFAEIEALGCQVRVLGSYPVFAYRGIGEKN